MNGETAELCALTANAKYALKHGCRLNYTTDKYVNSEIFRFLPRELPGCPENKEILERSARDWFERLLSLELTDIFMLLPGNADNRMVHGFANTQGGCILCFFKSGLVTFFTSEWSFDKEIRMWNIEFTEREWEDPPSGAPRFSDNTDAFAEVLKLIARLAVRIEERYWADIFQKAKDILDGNSEYDKTRLPDLPERNLRMYSAAAKADVFGAMGSWNDSPPYSAHEKGLSDDYNRLSDELFIQIQKALLFAVNEF